MVWAYRRIVQAITRPHTLPAVMIIPPRLNQMVVGNKTTCTQHQLKRPHRRTTARDVVVGSMVLLTVDEGVHNHLKLLRGLVQPSGEEECLRKDTPVRHHRFLPMSLRDHGVRIVTKIEMDLPAHQMVLIMVPTIKTRIMDIMTMIEAERANEGLHLDRTITREVPNVDRYIQ